MAARNTRTTLTDTQTYGCTSYLNAAMTMYQDELLAKRQLPDPSATSTAPTKHVLLFSAPERALGHERAINRFIDCARWNANTIMGAIPVQDQGGSWVLLFEPLISGLPKLFPGLGEQDMWTTLRSAFEQCILSQLAGIEVSVGSFKIPTFIQRCHGSTGAPKLKARCDLVETQASAAVAHPDPHAEQWRRKGPCGHTLFVRLVWSPASPQLWRCFTCFDTHLERALHYTLPPLNPAWWDSAIQSETSVERKRSLAELREYPWMTREFLCVLRVAAHMFGARDANCPVFTAAVAVLVDSRMRALGVDCVDLVLERMREFVLEVVVNERGPLYDQALIHGLFDWVERFESDTRIESLADFDSYMTEYCHLATLPHPDTRSLRPTQQRLSDCPAISLEQFMDQNAPMPAWELESVLAAVGLSTTTCNPPSCAVPLAKPDSAAASSGAPPSAHVAGAFRLEMAHARSSCAQSPAPVARASHNAGQLDPNASLADVLGRKTDGKRSWESSSASWVEDGAEDDGESGGKRMRIGEAAGL